MYKSYYCKFTSLVLNNLPISDHSATFSLFFIPQIQRNADPSNARYHGPLNCAKQIYKEQGLFRGIYRGLGFTLLRGLVCFI